VRDTAFQPDRGDFIWLDFTPQAVTEQAGRRPALVLSPRNFNTATGLAIVCPLTNMQTGSKFEIPLHKGTRLSGVVLSHQFRAVDWLAWNAAFHSKANEDLLSEVLSRIEAILWIETN
jgi:mRNA interferase MazF